MFKHHRIFRRAAALLLAMLLLVQPLAALAQEDAAPITHIAKSTVALKVRRAPDKDALGCDSIPRGSYVYILDYGNEWCRVRTDYAEGYVLTKYLADVIAQDGAPEVSDLMEEERNTEPVGEVQPGFTTNPSNFRESYYSHALVNARIYEAPSVNSRVLDTALMYEQVVVSEVSGDWCLARYKGRVYGYMLNETLFKWDRIDPYAGIIPGQDI